MPLLERPRERLESYGAENLSTFELLAIILRVGCKNQSAIEVAKSILHETNELSDLKTKTITELANITGVGKAKAIAILASIELGKRVLNPKMDFIKISSPNDVFNLLKNELMNLKQEVLIVLFLDLKTNLIAQKQIFVGSLNQSLIHPREVFKFAVKYSAFQIIMVHNHPSGDPEPSMQDLQVTKIFKEAGDMLQIKLIDHVIIGKNRYLSIMDYLKTTK
ncbi:MAG: DNA repair protein RadC [Firmicutes bacterium]|nr:DNA repair protein RadC [Bacillota bacterium]